MALDQLPILATLDHAPRVILGLVLVVPEMLSSPVDAHDVVSFIRRTRPARPVAPHDVDPGLSCRHVIHRVVSDRPIEVVRGDDYLNRLGPAPSSASQSASFGIFSSATQAG